MAAQKMRKFKQESKYPHKRSEGMSRRTNAGTKYQIPSKKGTNNE